MQQSIESTTLRSHFGIKVQVVHDLLDPRGMSLRIQRVTTITHKRKVWKPKLITVDQTECIKLSPAEPGLCSIIASMAELNVSTSARPTLRNVDGFVELKRKRNLAQASELIEAPASSKRRLFNTTADEDTPPKKKVKQTHDQLTRLRNNPSMFEVDVSHDAPVCFQRPIKHADDMIIRLDDESVKNAFEFIVNHGVGIDADDMFKKRAYRHSGEKGVWKFGNYFYTKDDDGLHRAPGQDEVDADGAEHDGNDEEMSDASACVGEDELPEAE
jgi:hypothetical protein